MVLESFNFEHNNLSTMIFMNSQSFISLIKNNACFERVTNMSSYENFSIMKTTFASEKPNMILYRDYKTFSHESFKNDSMSKTIDENIDYLKLEKYFIVTLRQKSPRTTVPVFLL